MKKAIHLFAIIILACAFSACNDSTPASSSTKTKGSNSARMSSADLWFNGGTLHRSTVSEWRLATDKNKLATCADFVATSDKNAMKDLDQFKENSLALVKCIDEAVTNDPGYSNMKLSAIAAPCASLLGIAK